MNKLFKRTFWDSKVQQKLGKKGGKIGGIQNTYKQKEARSKVGKSYGRSTGIGNQSKEVVSLLKNIFVFSHKSTPELEFVVGPCNAIVDLARELNQQCEDQNFEFQVPVEKVKGGSFYSLVKGTRPSAYGWIIKDIYDPNELFDLLQD